jgi:ligand-binding sensor domain-containing protein/signal transduction histidine kinase
MGQIRSSARVILVVLAIFAATLPALALPGEGTLDGLSRRLWEAVDGLPDQTVNALAQTPDGSLWIGTEGGLVRFDGVQFSSYDRESVRDGIDRGVNALFVARNGVLWIGTEGGGVIRYLNQHFERCLTNDRQGGIFVRAIYQDRRGTIWVGADQGLYRLNGNTLDRIDNTPQVPTIFVRTIVEDSQGNLWVGGTRLLEFSDNKLLRDYPLPSGGEKNVIMTMRFGRDGTMWLGMRSGLYRLGKNGSFIRAFDLLEPIDSITQETNGTIWIGTEGQGLYYIRGPHLFQVASSQLPSKTVLAEFEDRDGNLWLGTKAGLLRLSPTPVSIMPFPENADSEFETLYIDRDQSIWVAASTHFFHIRNGVVHPYEFPGLPGIRVRTLLRSRNGDLWIGTDGTGLIHLAHGAIHRYSAGHGLSNDFVRAILESRDGTIWVGSDGGLTCITANTSRILEMSNGLAYFSITAMYQDRDGSIWVGTSRGLSRWVDGKFVHDKIVVALSQERVWSINQDTSGIVWIGTSNGLYGVKDGNLLHITAASGLASNSVLQILLDGKGNIWLSSPNSISCIHERDLDNYRPGMRVNLSSYEDPYSLESTVFYSGMQPEGGIAANGDIWLASSKGAVRISPRKFVQIPPSPVTIDEARADDKLLSLGHRIVLKPGNSRLEISYVSVNLSAPSAIRYRYRMEGLEPWIEAGARRTAYYTHIPPGHYRFRVQAYEFGNPSQIREASIAVVQAPPIYKTPWFLVLSVLALLGSISSAYRFRLHRMRVHFQAINAERTRIAREMHDTVIQGCVGVSTLLEAALGLDASDESLRQHLLGYATEQTRSTIDSARSAVWALRNISKSNGNIGEDCHELVRRMQLESDIPIHFEVKGEPFKIGEDATHELLMTLKEAISNGIAHADASAIRLTITFEPKGAEIEISDDGRGFDLHSATRVKGHYGMIGMTERVKLLGGTLTIDSSRNKGTTIRLKLPRNRGVVR